MLVVRQNEKNIRNFDAFVHDAISKGWSSRATPKKVERKKENVERSQVVRKPIRTEILPEWFNKSEEVAKPLSISEFSTEILLKHYDVSKILSEMGNQKAKDQLIPLKEELAKRGVSMLGIGMALRAQTFFSFILFYDEKMED